MEARVRAPLRRADRNPSIHPDLIIILLSLLLLLSLSLKVIKTISIINIIIIIPKVNVQLRV